MIAWGRFTAEGGPEVEARITAILREARDALAAALSPSDVRAVVLLGGYGRGEGGVDTRAGLEVPHNNLDFLAVVDRGDPAHVKAAMDAALAPVAEKHRIGMDAGAMTAAALERSPCLVMWYDMRFGHKTILGDASYVPGLRQFTLERVVPWDVRNLLTNRATLVLINRLLLARGDLRDEEQRAVVRHAMKAVLGYGDAALFFSGRYDWSYVEKARRMAAATDLPRPLLERYAEAARFRFRPTYDAYLGRDLQAWNESLLAALEPVHLGVERARLSAPALAWAGYPSAAFTAALTEEWQRPRRLAAKGLALLRSRSAGPLAGRAGLGFRVTRPRERLPLMLPAVAYADVPASFRALAARALGASGEDPLALTRAYLRQWREHGDANFGGVVRRFGLTLDESGAP